VTPEGFVRDRIVDIATAAGSRVYMLKLPQKPTLPAVRVQRIGGLQDQHLRGPDGINRTRVQVDSYAAETADAYATVEALAADIRGDGLGASASGLWGFLGWSNASPSIQIVNVELDHDGTPDYEAGELRLLRIRQDYIVHWKDA
jgi:hypothetical protein